MTFSRTERSALADLLDATGPDAPTLCTGWTTRDLAAHLVARDRRPLSLPGLVLPPFAELTERVRQGLVDNRSYEDLVGLVRAGAPAWSPVGFPLTEPAANAVEFFVHHEDVRRGVPGWEVRDLPEGVRSILWARVRSSARLFLRRRPGTVVLRTPAGQQATVGSGEPHLVVTGDEGELLLFLFGRQRHAAVTVEGPEPHVRALQDASLGV